jgi:hypothetical protein
MKRLSILAILICSRTTFADPAPASDAAPAVTTAEAKTAEALIVRDMVQPLTEREQRRSRFSRGAQPAQARRVRILDEQPHKDAAGGGFLRFAVDARHGRAAVKAPWRLATITGCVYPDRNQIFVQRGDEYRPAAFLLGKNLKAVAETTCRPVADHVAHVR